MDLWLLTKVGFAVDIIVKLGYGISGIYLARTGVRYIQDYKYSIMQDEVGVDR